MSKTMFPKFGKGVVGEINVNVKTYPKYPVVFQSSTSDYSLFIADNTGSINRIKGNINSSTDCGFYGTQ